MAPEPPPDMPARALGGAPAPLRPAELLSPSRPFQPHERQALLELALTQAGPTGTAAALAVLSDAELVAAAGFTRLRA